MLMNRKTRPICHGRMGKGNNRCSRVSARILAESLLGTVKSKANRDVTTRLDRHWHCCFYSFSAQNLRYICGRKKHSDTFAEEKNKELEMATGIRPYQYEPVADINFGINWESSSDEEVPCE